MWNYSEKVKDHYMNPRNVGEMPDADAVGEVGNIVCGDALKLFLKIDKATGVIKDVKFQTYGCGSAIASSSALTEMVVGKTLDEALKISNQDIATYLDGLPPEKMHCSVMGREALEKAIGNYRGVKTQAQADDEGRIVCQCFAVTEDKIRRVIRENKLKTVDEITNYTKAGGGCGSCLADLEDILREELGKAKEAPAPAPPAKKKPLSNLQRMKLIQETLEDTLRPMIQGDGGDLELVDIDGTKVLVKLRGACARCAGAQTTLKDLIEKQLRLIVDPDIVVEEA